MNTRQFWSRYCHTLGEPSVAAKLRRLEKAKDSVWTAEMTGLLHRIGVEAGEESVVVDKATSPPESRKWNLGDRKKEYLVLDGVWLPKEFGKKGDDYKWCLPRVVIEHQNYDTRYPEGAKEKFALCLWKLMCVRAPLRILIAYMPKDEYESTREYLRDDIIHPLLDRDSDTPCEVLLIFDVNEASEEDNDCTAWLYSKDAREEQLTWES